MPRLFALIGCVALAASCALFGASEIPCEGDAECPAGQHCGAEGVCVDGLRPASVDGGVDAGTGSDAAAGNDAGAETDSGDGDSGAGQCQGAPCAPMPDSPTAYCRVSYDGDDPCPPEGDVYFGQDGSYLIQPLAFTEHSGGVIEELVTGLMWEQVAAQQERSQADAAAYCDGLELGEFDDWRLPELRELISLVDHGQTSPTHRLDPIAFPAPAVEPCWSASGYRTSDHVDQVWVLDLWSGLPDSAAPELGLVETYAVRCVRGPLAPEGLLTFTGGTWIDAATGLSWQGTDEPDLSWVESLVFCQELELGGHVDWRLPSAKELETLIGRNYDAHQDEVAVHEALRTSTAATSYWTSTPAISEYGGLRISMRSGSYSWSNMSGSTYTRCVRGP